MKPVAAIQDPLPLTGETLNLFAWHIPDLVAYQHHGDEWWFTPLDDNLPLIRLNRTGLDMLRAMNGHTTVGALLEQYSERLGQDGILWQRLARGEDTGPLVPAPEEEPFEASLELEWPIADLEPLSFVLTRLLDPLCQRLERRDRGTAALHLRLRLVTRDLHLRSLQLPSPMRDPKVLRTLLLLDLESHPAPAGIDAVTLSVDPTPGRIVQESLLTRALPAPALVSTLVARLQALMGEGRCGSPATVDSGWQRHCQGLFELPIAA